MYVIYEYPVGAVCRHPSLCCEDCGFIPTLSLTELYINLFKHVLFVCTVVHILEKISITFSWLSKELTIFMCMLSLFIYYLLIIQHNVEFYKLIKKLTLKLKFFLSHDDGVLYVIK